MDREHVYVLEAYDKEILPDRLLVRFASRMPFPSPKIGDRFEPQELLREPRVITRVVHLLETTPAEFKHPTQVATEVAPAKQRANGASSE